MDNLIVVDRQIDEYVFEIPENPVLESLINSRQADYGDGYEQWLQEQGAEVERAHESENHVVSFSSLGHVVRWVWKTDVERVRDSFGAMDELMNANPNPMNLLILRSQ